MKHVTANWNDDCAVTCSCGNTFTTGSVTDSLQVDICNKCHPFFTGEQRFVDRQGRVEKFLKKQQVAQVAQAAANKKQTKKPVATGPRQSYQDILRDQSQKVRSAGKNPQAATAAVNQ
ncbi:MAG: 50S ribosomal protein L31 [Candidatus Pacebacteria bacterium CG_4_10_14_0_8_um_filter_42_14]|nr:MAG: 50S ribosomal protein L31 [Candidatus Pacebacteria bacterium CG_4_10_14_0_8_um_filter_42_14]